LACSCITAVESLADGPVVDKVHHPYVLANEREFEWRLTSGDKDGTKVLAINVSGKITSDDALLIASTLRTDRPT
jgi:hypothetical protein